MKKKVLLLIVAVLALVCLTACTKHHDIIRSEHDNIVDAGKGEYIAVDSGKFYLYSMDKAKLLTDGYDQLEYIDADNSEYLLGYKTGDSGYAIIDNGGNTLIASDKDLKIKGARLIYDVILAENNVYNYSYYGFIVDFINAYGKVSTGLFHLDGRPAFVSEFCQTEVLKNSQTTKDFSIIYIYFTSRDISGKVIERTVIDKNLQAVCQLEFDQHKVFDSTQTFSTSIGYIVYTQKEFDENGDEIASKIWYDIYCNNTSYARYQRVSRISTFGNGNALFAQKDNRYTLFNESGIVAEFDSVATVENNNIKVGTDLVDIYKYDGTLLLRDVRQGVGCYLQQNDSQVTVYSYEGKELSTYDTHSVKRAETRRFVNLYTISEAVRHTDIQDKHTYKFFVGGVLAKEYGADYTYISDANGVYEFTTQKNNIIDYYYYYNVYSGTDYVVRAQHDGTNKASFSKVLQYKYYTEKHSKNITFYENATKTITPYSGPYIPGYACENGYFKITHHSLDALKMVVLKLEFDIYKVKKVHLKDVYTNLNQRWYAYYAITDTGKSANIMHIYAGPSKMTIDYSRLHGLMCFSTIDSFADKNLYTAVDRLDNKTLTFSVAQSKVGDRITLTKLSEIMQSNMAIFDGNYLIGTDHNNGQRNFVYTVHGKKVLDARYYVVDIKENLAVINYLADRPNNSYGIFDLAQNKILEPCDNFTVVLLGGGYHAIGKVGKTGILYDIKKGKRTVKNSVVSMETIRQRHDIDATYYYFKINIGDNCYKLLKITAPAKSGK